MIIIKKFFTFLFAVLFLGSIKAQEILEFMDLQNHTCMHRAYKFFGEGLTWFDEAAPPKLSYKHFFTNVNYANYLANNKGSRIIANGAIYPEVMASKKKAKRIILEQIRQVNEFAENNAGLFVVAKTPQEVRHYISETDKTVFIHCIEGGKMLINSAEDARFWAEQGVAFITLIHLIDDKYGGAGILPGTATRIINFKGSIKQAFGKNKTKGLTGKGKQAIQWLADAGILTDITHMSPQSRKDALTYMEQYHIPPLSTHDMFKPIQNHQRGIDEEDILRIYQLNGLVSLPNSGYSLEPYHPRADYAAMLDSIKNYCPGSIDNYKFTFEALQRFLEANIAEITNNPSAGWDELSESEKVKFAIGFQSDFNGWLNHSRPRYGKEGCFPIQPGVAYEPADTIGLAHPGLLESYWRILENEGVDLSPLRRASERFLQMWEYMLNYAEVHSVKP